MLHFQMTEELDGDNEKAGIGTNPKSFFSCSQFLEYVFTNMATREEDIWTVSSVWVHGLSRDCGWEGIHCLLCALRGRHHLENMQRCFEDLFRPPLQL